MNRPDGNRELVPKPVVLKKKENKKNRDGGDRTPGYGSEDRRVAITPHPYFYLTKIFIIPFLIASNTSSFHSIGISEFEDKKSIKLFLISCTSSYLLIFNHFSIGS